METLELIKKQIAENPVLLYMKGSPEMPQCGFSARAANCLKDLGVAFAFVDVLANPDIRRELPKYAEWPTFPQLWVRGELIGGSDIIAEMHASGELKHLLTSV
jgi:monothiol glutaredoxin